MSFQNEKIGMMDEGYFVSRGDILKWLNDLLYLNLTKIQQLGSGAVYCQVIDVVHPGKIAMAKVNWKAKNDYQFISNYRLLQDSFNKIGIKRYIEVEKLAKAKYQDNLEFAQWLKRYYDLNCGDRGQNYQAEERRGGINPNFGFAQKNVVPKTYNASGAVIPKKQSPPKNKQTVTEKPKKIVTNKPPTTQTGSRPIKKKQEQTSPSPQSKEKIKKSAEKEDLTAQLFKEELEKNQKQIQRHQQVILQQRERHKNQINQLRIDKEEIEHLLTQTSKDCSKRKEREESLSKEVKDLQDKMLMIRQILNSEEDPMLKVQMISQVVNIPTTLESQAGPTEQEDEAL